MNKLYLVLALLFALSACSVGQKCTYTQDGTRISSWVCFFNGDKPIDVNSHEAGHPHRPQPLVCDLGLLHCPS